METKKELEFYKSMDFMRLGQAVSHKQWQSAAMIIRRMDMTAREAGITEFERNFTGLRQCINRKDEKEAKQILALVVGKRAKYLNSLSAEEKANGKKMAEYIHVKHTFEPVYDEYSRILILGSLPSVKSREQGFYYGHSKNRFWSVLARLLGDEIPVTIEEKKEMLLKNHIAIWDVLDSCDIIGSSDSSIKNPIAADIQGLLRKTSIKQIYANGGTAGKFYRKLVQPETEKDILVLQSTSPLNCRFSLDDLVENWKVILEEL